MTVIPMRYGSRVECPYEAIGLLRKNQDAYGALLHELEGLAEMGIQLLLDNSGAGTESNPWPVPPRSIPLFCASGAAYLAAKRQRYLGAGPGSPAPAPASRGGLRFPGRLLRSPQGGNSRIEPDPSPVSLLPRAPRFSRILSPSRLSPPSAGAHQAAPEWPLATVQLC